MRNFVAKIEYINDFDYSSEVGYAVIQANNYGEAAERIEDSYRNDLVGFTIDELEEGPVFDISKNTYMSIMGNDEV